MWWCISFLLAGREIGSFFSCGGKVLLRPEKKDTVVCLAGARSLLRPEKKRYSLLSVGCAILAITTGKKDTVVCLAGCAVVLCQFLVLAGNWQFFCCGGKFSIRPEKKGYSRLSGGCAIIIMIGKKKDIVVCLLGARFWRLRPEKKDTVVCLTGCAVVLFFVVAGNFDYDRKKNRYSCLSSLANVCIFVQPNTLLLCIFNLFFSGCNSF